MLPTLRRACRPLRLTLPRHLGQGLRRPSSCKTVLDGLSARRETSEESAPELSNERSEDELVERDLVRAAVDALGQLSSEDQETLLATFSEEAASVTGATLRKRRQRALERLKTAFRRLYGLG
jgi:RNA polymerase sigma-70 factor (ECF subfamily)